MTWSADQPYIPECRKMRHRVASYLVGRGLDLGCGPEKVVDTAIGVDFKRGDIQTDLSAPDSLGIFADATMDYVFSSHCLEDLVDYTSALREWWRVIRPGGYMVLYGPDPDYYPRVGTEGANVHHQHDLYLTDVWGVLRGFGNARLIHQSRHNESNEYSWQLVVRKELGVMSKVREIAGEVIEWGRRAFPMPNKPKTVLVIRYGALGDSVWMTPVLRRLKQDGYYVVYNTTEYGAQVLKECPWIDEFLIQPQDGIPQTQLQEFWQLLGGEFTEVLNFSGSIEKNLLKPEGSEGYHWSHEKRHRECNHNYMDTTMGWAGYPDAVGERPELHFSEVEENLVQQFRQAYKDKFLVVWALCGSSFHKHYPWTPYVVGQIEKDLPDDVIVVTVGDKDTQMIEPRFPCVVAKAGHLGIRQAMCLTKYADCVIGPETGVMNAASCYDVPKIIMLSHSSEDNLTRHWTNTTALHPESCPCHPCHQLHYSRRSCPMGDLDLAPLCVENMRPERVYEAFRRYFDAWKKGEPINEPAIRCVKTPRYLHRKTKARPSHKTRRSRQCSL